MIVRNQKRPVAYTERQQLRHDELPGLYSFNRPPTLAETTTTEITDIDIGLKPDPVAQETAERLMRAAIAYRMKQDERAQARRRPVTPVSIRIALAADDEPDTVTLPEVVEMLAPERGRLDG